MAPEWAPGSRNWGKQVMEKRFEAELPKEISGRNSFSIKHLDSPKPAIKLLCFCPVSSEIVQKLLKVGSRPY